jgi:hypothetical protein
VRTGHGRTGAWKTGVHGGWQSGVAAAAPSSASRRQSARRCRGLREGCVRRGFLMGWVQFDGWAGVKCEKRDD